MQSLTLFQPMCSFEGLTALAFWWNTGSGLWIKPWGFWHFSLTVFFFYFSIFAPLLASVLFGGGPDDGVVLLRHMQSPGSPGTPFSLAGEGLLGDESQLWGSGEVPTLWSRPLGGPAQAQTQLGMEPVLRIGGVHRKWTTLCWQGKRSVTANGSALVRLNNVCTRNNNFKCDWIYLWLKKPFDKRTHTSSHTLLLQIWHQV